MILNLRLILRLPKHQFLSYGCWQLVSEFMPPRKFKQCPIQKPRRKTILPPQVSWLYVGFLLLMGTLRSDDGDGNGNATKTIGLISKTTILHVHHAFLYISLPSLHGYDVKMPNFTMYRGSTEATTKFPLSFWTWK